MKKILVIVERHAGAIDDSAWELLTLARALAGGDGTVSAALLGEGLDALAAELAKGFDNVHVFDDSRLAVPDAEGDGLALVALIEREGYSLTLAAHTNLSIDLLPWLSVKVGGPLLADCFELAWRGDELEAKRTVFEGKVHAKVATSASDKGYFATVRGGAFEGAAPAANAGGAIQPESLPADFAPRRKALRTVEPEAGEVDITASEVLIAVGRGIEEEENLEIINSLAEAAGAAVCCSRPVVDKGWLPKARQVGTSGLTVSPKLYVAVGISGSFQHMGGVKGSSYLVAINKDAKAPIFGVADVGIVGDLFEVIPALEEEFKKVRS